MGREEIETLLREHAAKHPGLVGMVCRVVAYTAILMASMFLAGHFGHDTYAANAALFVLFATAYELLSQRASHTGVRFWGYVLCVVGLTVSGGLLIREGLGVQAQAHGSQNRPVVARPMK
jgi:drug/metabolite transporter superfamily protein YnfA